jgi:hypothetical protein
MGQMEEQIAVKKFPTLTFLGQKMLPKRHNSISLQNLED